VEVDEVSVSKKWIKEELERLRFQIYKVEQQVSCKHVDCSFYSVHGFNSKEVTSIRQHCHSCNIDIIHGKEEGLEIAKKFHGKKIEFIESEDNG
jgi:MinD superfamily P-loop ATPase